MNYFNNILAMIASIFIIAACVMYINANTKTGCFLGYCGAVIKAPG